ncbi:MAG: hypothetical protein O2798_03950 [Chloroflexi bacterium]|nr:hypothetical protein [Chloroflexota bacterium]
MTEGPAGLAALHLDALYEREGTTLHRVRSTDVPTPLVHLLRTPEGNHWLISAAVPPSIRARLEALFAAEPVLPLDAYESTPPESLDAARRLLDGASREHRGPAFAFPAEPSAIRSAPPGYTIDVL